MRSLTLGITKNVFKKRKKEKNCAHYSSENENILKQKKKTVY